MSVQNANYRLPTDYTKFIEAFRCTLAVSRQESPAIESLFPFASPFVSPDRRSPIKFIDFYANDRPFVARIRIDELVNELECSDFLFTERVLRQAVQTGNLFQLLDKTESLKLDIYPRELIPGELQRSQTMELFPGIFLPVVSRTDAEISKLIWTNKGSQRSRRDFRSIFRSGSEIQPRDIRAQAEKIRLMELLEEVLSESDEIR